MRPALILLCFVAVAIFATTTPAVAGCGPNGCTIEVPFQYETTPASYPVANTIISTAGRSVASVGKMAVALSEKPIRVIVAVASKKPIRSALKTIASKRPLRAADVGDARLIWHRTSCRQ